MSGKLTDGLNNPVNPQTGADPQDYHSAAAPAAAATRFINARRRAFLQGTAVAGAAVVAGDVAAGEMAVAVQPETEAPAGRSAGYRVTDHVRTYYDRARF